MDETVTLAKKALHEDNATELRQLLNENPDLKRLINEPVGPFNSPAILEVKSTAMLDVLLDAGADINARSNWWAGSFGVLELAPPDVCLYAIERGAVVTVHAAARLGMLGRLQELIKSDPSLVHARGGDGQTPLHFASNVTIADYLLEHGADIDAQDIDHESTPAQWMIRSRQEIVRFLLERGCRSDILMAAALGDIPLAKRLLDADPECIRMRVSDAYFPKQNPRSGGTIYQWELGWHVSACQVAQSFGHDDMLRLLMERSPAEEQLLNACWLHDEALVESLLAGNPSLADKLTEEGRRQLAHAARNNNTEAARLLLRARLPVDSFGQHHASPLHWASWHGNAELVRLTLARNPALEDNENDFSGTPLVWALHGSMNGWFREKGDYPATVNALLDAGARMPAEFTATEPVKATLRKRGLLPEI